MRFFKIDELPKTPMLPGIERCAVWLDDVMLTFFTFEPHSVIPEHAHPNEQITLVTKGAMDFMMGGETRRIGAGEGVCIPPDTPHRAVILDEPTEAVDAWSPPRDDYKT